MSNKFDETEIEPEIEPEIERQELISVVIGCIIAYAFLILVGVLIGKSMFV